MDVSLDRRPAMAAFCNGASFRLLAFGNIEMDPDHGRVHLRHSLLLPIGDFIDDRQLEWFVTSSMLLVHDLELGVVEVAKGEDPQAVISLLGAKLFQPKGAVA